MELASHEAKLLLCETVDMVLPVVVIHTARLLSSPFDLLSVFSPSSIRARIYGLIRYHLGFFSGFIFVSILPTTEHADCIHLPPQSRLSA